MNSAVINIKIEPKLKAQAQKVAKDLGISLSALIRGFIIQLVRRKSLFLSLKNESNLYLEEIVREIKKEEGKKHQRTPHRKKS